MDVIRIAALADDTTSLIEQQTFDGVEIRGPAIVAPLEGVVFDDCVFEGTFDGIFKPVPIGTLHVGVIGLRQVVFRRCRFRNVGVIAPDDLIQKFAGELRGEGE